MRIPSLHGQGQSTSLIPVPAPSAPTATFKITGDVLHIAFHPSGQQFAVVCPRSTRDEVFFYHLTPAGWEARGDIAMGGPLIDIGAEEVSASSALSYSETDSALGKGSDAAVDQ